MVSARGTSVAPLPLDVVVTNGVCQLYNWRVAPRE